MIKRSSGFFKIAFFVFCLFIALFLILFSLTDIRNYVTAEICIFVFCVSITIIPLILELIIYALGLLTKGIQVSSKEEIIKFKPMKNSKVPYASINENGLDKMMFFCDKGRITILTARSTKIHWGEAEDKIVIKSKFGECFAIFKSIYGTKYENFECDVYTTLAEEVEKVNETKREKKVEKTKPVKNTTSSDDIPVIEEKQKVVKEHVLEVKEEKTIEPPKSNVVFPKEQVSNEPMEQPEINIDANPKPLTMLESVEEFDYSLNDTDTLFEETIKL